VCQSPLGGGHLPGSILTTIPRLVGPPDTTLSPSPLSSMPVDTYPPAEKGLAMTAKSTKSKKTARAKSAKAAKSTKPKPSNPSHVPTPWLKLKQMWEAGQSYEAMAKATDAHYAANKPDPTKPTRAKIWKARNIGVKIEGKLVRFGARGKAKEETKKGKTAKGVKTEPRKPNRRNTIRSKAPAVNGSEQETRIEQSVGPKI
jgi:hypothetical protein